MEQTKNFDFRKLDVWQQCQIIRKRIWSRTRRFPMEERYRLTDQMIKASRSATACIAEGYGRFHFQENIQFCRPARGSLYELIDHIETGLECSYLNPQESSELIQETQKAIWILNGYIKYLKQRKTETDKHSTSQKPLRHQSPPNQRIDELTN